MKMVEIEQVFQRIAQAMARRPCRAALGIFVVSILIHAPFAVLDGFGEQDAARLAVKAINAHHAGQLQVGGQWALAYPGYIHALYWLVHSELLHPHALPPLMAILSLVSSGLFTMTFFLFFRIVLKTTTLPLVGAVLLQFVPIFWVSSLYGFPTIMALALFMTANWLWASGLRAERTSRRWGAAAGALLLFQSSICIKVDLVLAALLFCLPIWAEPWGRRQKAVAIGVVVIAAGIVFTVLNYYGGSLSADQTTSESWSSWGDTFFSGVAGFFHPRHLRVIYRALGVATLWGAGASLCLLVYRRRHLNALFWIVAAGAPSALFWSLMAGNSARHNLILAAMLPMILALPLDVVSPRYRRAFLGGLAVLLLFNYFWFPPSSSTVKPSGRLIGSALRLQEKVSSYHRKGRRLASEGWPKVVVMGSPHLYPYYRFELLAAARQVLENKQKKLVFRDRFGTLKTYVFIDKTNRNRVKALSAERYKIIRLP